jgi:hypothetical protein
MNFIRHWTQLPNHIDMSPYYRFYRGVALQVKGTTFVELGAREGCSARMIMDALGDKDYKLYLYDIVHSEFLDELIADPRVSFLQMRAEEAVNMFRPGQIDFLHIDLDPHIYEQTSNIFTLYEPKVGKGGIIVFHDCTPDFPGVYDFVKNNIEPQPEWVVEYEKPQPECAYTAPAMAVRIS